MENVLGLSDLCSRTRPGSVLGLSDSLLKGESRSPRTPTTGWAEDAQEEISYTLFGEPLPMPRPRVGRWGVKPPSDAVLELKSRHAEAASSARPSGWNLSGPLAVYIVCYRGTKRRCDADNLAKLPLDSLTGIAWEDDSQVETLHVEKRMDALDPRTEVRVIRLDPEAAAEQRRRTSTAAGITALLSWLLEEA